MTLSGVHRSLLNPAHGLAGQVLSGRYELKAVIGSGGMATVFRALDRRLQRDVAVKVLYPHLASDARVAARFQREAQYAARLSAHPKIVAIHDVGESGGLQYIVMELVQGESLRCLLLDGQPLPVPRTLNIGRQVAEALDSAHEHGIIHRDVKPENILLAAGDQAKVTDFGIAHAAGAEPLTKTGLMVGTASYVSPEQAIGKPAGRASDIYSLAVVLYEMLTGRPPFRAETPLALALMHTEEEPVPPESVNPRLTPSLSFALLRGLSKSPGDRYATAGDLVAALERSAGQSTIQAPLSSSAGVATRVDPVPARSRKFLSLALAALICLAAVAAFAAWEASSATQRQTRSAIRSTVPARARLPTATTRPTAAATATARPTGAAPVAAAPTRPPATVAPTSGAAPTAVPLQPTAAPTLQTPPQPAVPAAGNGPGAIAKHKPPDHPGPGHADKAPHERKAPPGQEQAHPRPHGKEGHSDGQKGPGHGQDGGDGQG